MSKIDDFSETVHNSLNINLTATPTIKLELEKEEPNQKQKKMIFEVFHKKEIIYINQDSSSKNEDNKNILIQYKCVYCSNLYNNMNRFEAHMKMHVS